MSRFCFVLFLIVILSSCNSSKKISYAQNAGEIANLKDTASLPMPESRIKPGDLFSIVVNTTSSEVSLPFNLPLMPDLTEGQVAGMQQRMNPTLSLQSYLVDKQGHITFPVLGQINVLGMTKTELADYLKKEIYPRYIKQEPIITIRYLNYKVSILGEVNRPGSYPINNERVTLYEALALAGDMTIFGRRENVLLIREDGSGKKETVRLDLRDKDLITSKYFYLQQNDVLYVQPNKPKARASGFSTAESISISIVGTLISVASLIATLTR